jgi:hypothetical protein
MKRFIAILVCCVLVDSALAVGPVITVVSPASETWTADTTVVFDVNVVDANDYYAFIDWEDSLVGWWRWEGNASDESGNGNSGTLGASAGYTAARFGQGISVPYGQHCMTIADSNELAFSKYESWTFAIWVYMPANRFSELVGKGGRFRVMLKYDTSSGSPRWVVELGSGVDDYHSMTHSETQTIAWRQGALVWDAPTSTAHLYVDGAHVQQMTVDITGNFTTTGPLTIGYANGTGAIVDDFMIFNRALSATEIAALYDASTHGIDNASFECNEMVAYEYTIWAVNSSAQAVSESGTITVDVSNSAPTGSVTYPITPTRTSETTVTLSGTASDMNVNTTLALATLWWDVGQDPGALVASGQTDVLSGESDTWSFVMSGLDAGTITWNVKLKDSSDNEGWIASDQELRIGQDEYYVATTGNDTTGDGTIGNPWLTVQKFADQCYPGDICYIRTGTYRETITPVRSGNSGAPIIFQAYNGETVTVSGLDIVSGSWTQHSSSIYRTTAMDWDLGRGLNQVFVDGAVVMEARWPDADGYFITSDQDLTGNNQSTESNGILQLHDGDLSGVADNYWNGGTVHVIWSPFYHAGTGLITDTTDGYLTVDMDCAPSSNSPASAGVQYYYVTGHYNALTSAGEWYYDSDGSQTGNVATLYLWVPSGGSPGSHTVEAKARQVAFDLDGRGHIHLSGIDLFGANITTTETSEGVQIDDMTAEYVSHYMVIDEGEMDEGQKGTRDTGIVLAGDDCQLTNSTIRYSSGNGVSLIGSNSTVSECAISYCNYMVTEAACVGFGHETSENNTVTHCTLHHAGRSIVNHVKAYNATITYNDMSYNRAGLYCADLGATYAIATDGRGTTIAYNRIHDIYEIGIYLDNETSQFNIHHNVVYGVIAGAGSVQSGIHMNTPSENNKVFNNTLVDGSLSCNTISGLSTSMEGTEVRNNIAYRLAASDFTTRGAVVSNNIHTDPSVGGVDPLYVDGDGHNYRLSANSPAINAGVDVGFTSDYLGHLIKGVPDIGAYERAGSYIRIWKSQ